MNCRIKIKKDLFGIAERIKKIDKNYFILYNCKNKKFEVHSSSQKKSTYCLTSPYPQLDARLINFVLKTRIENYKKIYREIEENNARLERELLNKREDFSTTTLKDIYSFANASTKSLDCNKILKNIWL